MVRQGTLDWLHRLTTSEFQTGASLHAREILSAMNPRDVADHARELLATLDDADRDDGILAAIENKLLDPDDLVGQVRALAELRGRLEEALLPEWPELDNTPEAAKRLDDEMVATAVAHKAFVESVRAMLIGTGVLAADDQTSNPVDLLRLFLPSPKPTELAA